MSVMFWFADPPVPLWAMAADLETAVAFDVPTPIPVAVWAIAGAQATIVSNAVVASNFMV